MKTLILVISLLMMGCQHGPCPKGMKGHGTEKECVFITFPFPTLTSPGRNLELTAINYTRHFYRQIKWKRWCNEVEERKSYPECKTWIDR